MKLPHTLALAASLVVPAIPACSNPRTPGAATSADADGGELTCEERARAQSLCRSAMGQRCESQGNDCEATCDVHGDLPANTEKSPTARNDMESTQCRANCRQTHDGCLRSIAVRCPALCGN
jgi:hypothetical protein